MLRSCAKCGRIHDTNFICTPKAKRKYERSEENSLRSKSSWQKKRESIKERSYFLCSVCRDLKDYSPKDLEVHHIIKLRDDPSLFLDDSNLIALCLPHHEDADRGKLDVEYLRKLARERDERW